MPVLYIILELRYVLRPLKREHALAATGNVGIQPAMDWYVCCKPECRISDYSIILYESEYTIILLFS